MTNDERLFKKHERLKVAPVSLEFDRFTVDDKPACMAWYGSKEHPPMACFFLMRELYSNWRCNYLNVNIWYKTDGELIPPDDCPLWMNDRKEK